MKYTTKKQVTQLSYEVLGYAIKVHKALGPGLLESVYEKCLKYELIKNGYNAINQINVPIKYDALKLEADLKLDILVEDTIIIELKTVENILPVHKAQLLTYMKLLQKPQGLLINFYVDNISRTAKPFVNEYFRELPDE
jgi:GxxExxY protein